MEMNSVNFVPPATKDLFLILHDVTEHEESVTVKCETIATLVPWSLSAAAGAKRPNKLHNNTT